VTVRARNDSHASLIAYTRKAGHWRKTLGPIPAVVGKHGITLNKHEGDLKSPAGIFYLGPGFGSAKKPAGAKLPYTRTSKNDYWIDDPSSADYNRWVTYAGDPDARWKSYERLLIPAYRYAVVIRYNMYPVIKGRGSAIFLHLWPGPDGSTVGCTAVSEQNLLALMKWFDPIENPVIIQGAAVQLKALAHSTPNPRSSLTKRPTDE
jgi:L,D-peptidoglycan transpeptidase YkuD (ErfK/YbiS/YcfS/YnhG family)